MSTISIRYFTSRTALRAPPSPISRAAMPSVPKVITGPRKAAMMPPAPPKSFNSPEGGASTGSEGGASSTGGSSTGGAQAPFEADRVSIQGEATQIHVVA